MMEIFYPQDTCVQPRWSQEIEQCIPSDIRITKVISQLMSNTKKDLRTKEGIDVSSEEEIKVPNVEENT
ncbi:unnamed protein product [Paramecium octaurelia]|uniref:Uncharacterized protein n=1 Tax=Paramecium octaurelia TaxID=43137 RepID=A0A8S1XC47_PAROT|nr:unnamed protein product [Paramecium octaurelia]